MWNQTTRLLANETLRSEIQPLSGGKSLLRSVSRLNDVAEAQRRGLRSINNKLLCTPYLLVIYKHQQDNGVGTRNNEVWASRYEK